MAIKSINNRLFKESQRQKWHKSTVSEQSFDSGVFMVRTFVSIKFPIVNFISLLFHFLVRFGIF